MSASVAAPVRIGGELLELLVDGGSVVVRREDGTRIDVSDHPGAPALADVAAELADLRVRLEQARALLDEFAERVDARGSAGPVFDRIRTRFSPLRDRARAWTTAEIARGTGSI